MLSIWLVAGVVAFLPFAFNTSAWDAVTFRVPGNQGNWWHFLAGAPFFLAFPMIWLRLRWLFSAHPLTEIGQRLMWGFAGLSMVGTILVETPFLLHLAGTSAWQRLAVLSLGFGIMIASAVLLVRRRRYISPVRACLLGYGIPRQRGPLPGGLQRSDREPGIQVGVAGDDADCVADAFRAVLAFLQSSANASDARRRCYHLIRLLSG
jgi:hypothetical protein